MDKPRILTVSQSLENIKETCIGTIKRYLDSGFMAHVLVVSRKGKLGNAGASPESYASRALGIEITGLHVVPHFDFSEVTQDNVNILREFIDRVNPKLAIIPSIRSYEPAQRILGKSSLLACRPYPNILMYDNSKRSRQFMPTLYSLIPRNYAQVKTRHGSGINSKNAQVEAFESHRIVLNDLF